MDMDPATLRLRDEGAVLFAGHARPSTAAGSAATGRC